MRREVWDTPDGDELHLDFIDGPPGSPLLLALHGLEGCSQSLYIHGLLDRARRLALTGVSMGGNVLLKWLGEREASVPEIVRAATAISTPYDLAAAADHLESGLGPLYTRYFLGSLKEKALRYAERYPGVVDVDGVGAARTFRAYDDAAVAPIHGFADAADYYARTSSMGFLEQIRVPTLLISAADDPFLPAEILDEVRERSPTCVECFFTEAGGHVGFVTGPPWAARSWAEDRAVDFLARRIG
jgi:predicted alpha/beta-fold hydrolase